MVAFVNFKSRSGLFIDIFLPSILESASLFVQELARGTGELLNLVSLR